MSMHVELINTEFVLQKQWKTVPDLTMNWSVASNHIMHSINIVTNSYLTKTVDNTSLTELQMAGSIRKRYGSQQRHFLYYRKFLQTHKMWKKWLYSHQWRVIESFLDDKNMKSTNSGAMVPGRNAWDHMLVCILQLLERLGKIYLLSLQAGRYCFLQLKIGHFVRLVSVLVSYLAMLRRHVLQLHPLLCSLYTQLLRVRNCLPAAPVSWLEPNVIFPSSICALNVSSGGLLGQEVAGERWSICLSLPSKENTDCGGTIQDGSRVEKSKPGNMEIEEQIMGKKKKKKVKRGRKCKTVETV